MTERILLIGMMGAGKSVVGRLLAERLGWRHIDSDEQVLGATGRTVREIFERDGEAAFRREEARALAAAVSCDEPAVISVAGGAVLDPANRRRIAEAGTVVWLDAPVDVLTPRALAESHRPLLDGDAFATMQRLAAERRPLYAEVADVVVDASVDAHDVAARVMELVR